MRTIDPLNDESTIREEVSRNMPQPAPTTSKPTQLVDMPTPPPIERPVHTGVQDVNSQKPNKLLKNVLGISVVIALCALYFFGPFILPKMLNTDRTARTGNNGWSTSKATAAWQKIEGVEGVKVLSHYWHKPPGPKSQESDGNDHIIEIKVKPDYHISDPSEFLKYAMETLWALNDIERTKHASSYPGDMIVMVSGGVTDDYEWGVDTYKLYDAGSTTISESMRKEYGDTPPYKPSSEFTSDIRIYGSLLERRLGAYVGNPPSINRTFIEKGAPVTVAYDPIESSTLRRTDDGCYNFTVKRAAYGGHEVGTTDAFMKVDIIDGGSVIATSARQWGLTDVNFCLNERQKSMNALQAHITMPAREIYPAVDSYYVLDIASVK